MSTQLIGFAVASLALSCGSNRVADSCNSSSSVHIEGSVVLADDLRRAPASGSFALLVVDAQGTTTRSVVVDHGRWSIDLPERFAELSIGRMSLENRDAHCELVLDSLPATRRIELDAHWTQHNTLEVVDKSTGVAFERGLELVESGNRMYPSASDVRVGRDLASPIELPEFDERGATPGRWRAMRSWWVRAPGFAWRRVDVNHWAGRSVRLELQPGGDLHIAIGGRKPLDRVRVRVAHGSESGYLDPSSISASRTIALDGLAPDFHRVSLERRTGASSSEIGHSDALVVVGRAIDVALEPTIAQSDPPTMAMSGTLRIPSSWSASGPPSFSIELRRRISEDVYPYVAIEPPRTTQIDAETWNWDAGWAGRGHYIAYVRPFRRGFGFDYDPANASDFALVIPPAADVCVKLIDELGHQPITDESVAWFGAAPSDSDDVPPDVVRFDARRGGYCFTAPAGDLVLCTNDAKNPNRRTTVHVAAGANSIELAFAPFAHVRVFALENGGRVNWPDGLSIRVQRNGFEVRTHSMDWGREANEIALETPGRYTIEIDDPFGEQLYAPASVEVEAVVGRTVEVDLPIRRL